MNLLKLFAPFRLVGKHDYRPYMTFSILVAYLVVFGWEIVLTVQGGQPIDAYLPTYAFAPCEIGHAPITEIMLDGVRGVFMTTSFFALLVNMMYFWIFGPLVEEFLGYRRFLALFVLGGIGGFIISALLNQTCDPLYGPNAGVAAVIAAFIFLYPTKRIETIVSPLMLRRFDIPAVLFGFVYIGLQFVLEGDGPLSGTFAPVWAEIGGFVFGFLFIFLITLFKPAPKVDPLENLVGD